MSFDCHPQCPSCSKPSSCWWGSAFRRQEHYQSWRSTLYSNKMYSQSTEADGAPLDMMMCHYYSKVVVTAGPHCGDRVTTCQQCSTEPLHRQCPCPHPCPGSERLTGLRSARDRVRGRRTLLAVQLPAAWRGTAAPARPATPPSPARTLALNLRDSARRRQPPATASSQQIRFL